MSEAIEYYRDLKEFSKARKLENDKANRAVIFKWVRERSLQMFVQEKP